MRPLTRDELQNELSDHIYKLGTVSRREMQNPDTSLERLQQIASSIGVPTEREASPPPRRMPSPTSKLGKMNAFNVSKGYPEASTEAEAQRYTDSFKYYADKSKGTKAGAGAGAGAGVGTPPSSRDTSPSSESAGASAGAYAGSPLPSYKKTKAREKSPVTEKLREFVSHMDTDQRRALTPGPQRTGRGLSVAPPRPAEASEKFQAHLKSAMGKQTEAGAPGHAKALADIYKSAAKAPASDTVSMEGFPVWFQKALQHATKGIFQAAGNGPYLREGPLMVDPSHLTEKARERVLESSPYSEENQARNKVLHDIMLGYTQDKTAEGATKQYLNRLSQNPAKMHNELMGNTERDFNKAILDQSTREFNEKILPGIHAKYQTPGLRQHGHMGKDIGEAAEQHGRGVSQKLAEAGIGMRHMTLNAANQYGTNQAHAAGISGQAAMQDRQNNLKALGGLEELRKDRNLEIGSHIADLAKMGAADEATAQKLLDAQNAEKQRLHNYSEEKAAKVMTDIKGISPGNVTSATGIGPVRPDHTQGQTSSAIGETLFGLGGKMFPQQRKKGGRIKRADGGPVTLQDAVQNAVIDKRDPISELRQMIYHAQGVNALQGRQPLKIGGSVDPIKAGAEDAHMYAGHAAMKNKLERMRNPSFASSLASATNLDEKTPGWLANGMRAFHRGYASNQQNINSADDLEYELQSKLEDKAERERKLANEEQHVAAQIAHLRAQDAKSVLEGQKIQHEINQPKPPKLGKEDLSIMEQSRKSLTAAEPFINKLDRLNELTDNINTGGFTSTMPILGSPRVQSIIGKGKQGEYDEFDKITNSLVADATAAFGSRGGARIAAIIERGKPNRDMSPEGLKAIIAEMKAAIEDEEALSHHVYDQYEQGVKPTSAFHDYTKKRIADRPTKIKVEKPLDQMTDEEINALP
jgi:hypothetical protein